MAINSLMVKGIIITQGVTLVSIYLVNIDVHDSLDITLLSHDQFSHLKNDQPLD